MYSVAKWYYTGASYGVITPHTQGPRQRLLGAVDYSYQIPHDVSCNRLELTSFACNTKIPPEKQVGGPCAHGAY